MRTRLYSLEELDDIPANRDMFRLDESAYLNRFRMSVEQKQSVLDRDFNQLIELGGNIYFLVKLSNTDGWSTQKAVGSMTGMTPDEYAAIWVKEFQRKEDPDVVILCYNDHASAMMLDVVPTVMGDPVLPMQCSRILPVSTCRSGAPAA
jgi:protocatechuate 4,5-dioxygenase alpha chain